MYNLIGYSDNIQKHLEFFQKYCKNVPAINAANINIFDFTVASSITYSYKINEKITGETGGNGKKNVEIIVPLKYLSNFWRTLEMSLINCEINLDLKWSKNCVIVATDVADQEKTLFSTTDTKLYVPVVTLSTQDNAKQLKQLVFGFKRTFNWNKYQLKKSTERKKTIFRLLN